MPLSPHGAYVSGDSAGACSHANRYVAVLHGGRRLVGLLAHRTLGGDMSQEPWAELGETVSAIRTQLQQALEEGRNEPLRFRTGPVELEFSIEVRKEGEAKTRILVLPWSAEARAGVESSNAKGDQEMTSPDS